MHRLTATETIAVVHATDNKGAHSSGSLVTPTERTPPHALSFFRGAYSSIDKQKREPITRKCELSLSSLLLLTIRKNEPNLNASSIRVWTDDSLPNGAQQTNSLAVAMQMMM